MHIAILKKNCTFLYKNMVSTLKTWGRNLFALGFVLGCEKIARIKVKGFLHHGKLLPIFRPPRVHKK